MIVAFDIETASPADDEHQNYHLGVTCAALAGINERGAFFSDAVHSKWMNMDGRYTEMCPDECWGFAQRLAKAMSLGYTVVSWNGLGFDWRVLAEMAGPRHYAGIAKLALVHTDPAFYMLCKLGYMAGLNAVAHGMGIDGKMEGMDGLQAIAEWRHGDQQGVLDYVTQDARATLDVYLAILNAGEIRWITKKGKEKALALPGKYVPTAEQCLEYPVPRLGWMKPWPREDFCGWILGGDHGVSGNSED